MAREIGPYDIRLQDVATSPTTAVGLMLATDENGRKQWREMRVPPLPPRQSQGAVSWTHKDPMTDFIWAQDDWTGGALQTYWKPEEPNRYAAARRIDARWPGVLAMGPLMRVTGLCIPDCSGEFGSIWAAAGGAGTLSVGTDVPTATIVNGAGTDDGTRSFKFISSVGVAAGGTLFSVSLANPTLYRGVAISVSAFLKRDSGTETGIKIRISDSAGNGTDSNEITSGTYASARATHTVDAGATSVTIKIIVPTEITVEHQFHVDRVLITLPGGTECVGFAQHTDGALYTAVGRGVFKLNGTNGVWDLVYLHASANATSIVAHGGQVYVAFGLSNAYIYGSGTSWTASNRGGTDQVAKFFATNRNELWKNETAATNVSSSTDGLNAGTAWTDYTVGHTSADITGLYGLGDSMIVGKQDGIYAFIRTYNDGTAANLFKNITGSWNNVRSTDNFKYGVDWNGTLWTTMLQQSLIRYDGQRIADSSGLLTSPRVLGTIAEKHASGAVRGLSAEPRQLWAITATSLATSMAYHALWSIMPDGKGGFVPHHIDTMRARNLYAVSAMSNSTFGSNGYGTLFAAGDVIAEESSGDVGVLINFWDMPATSPAPFLDTTPRMARLGYLTTAKWHGGLPDTDKAFIALTLWLEDCDADNTVVVTYGLNNAAPTTTTLATYSSSGIVTKYFSAVASPTTTAVGAVIQFRFNMNQANTSGPSPKIYAMALHSTLRPDRVRAWEMTVVLDGQELLGSGYLDTTSKTTKLANLSTLEEQVFPIVLNADFNDDGAEETIYGHILDLQQLDEDSSRRISGQTGTLYRMVFQEVVVA